MLYFYLIMDDNIKILKYAVAIWPAAGQIEWGAI